MKRLQSAPTKSIKRSILWLDLRRRMVYKVLTGRITLSEFLSEFPPLISQLPGEDLDSYMHKLVDHFEAVAFNELWIDRFLFEAPTEDVVHRIESPYPWMRVLPVWYHRKHIEIRDGMIIDRSYPISFENGIPKLAPDFTGAPWGGPGPISEGDEFEYYSTHFPRRRR